MTEATISIGLVQMTGGVEPAANLDAAEALIRDAAGQGARLIVTPEATNVVQRDNKALFECASTPESDPAPVRFSALADELGVWLLIGSLMQRVDERRIANRSYLFSADGKTVATYDKIHLFDVDFGDGERYAESDRVRPGDRAVVAQTPLGGLGLSVCYDLRFPYLYRTLAHAGADVLAVPAAFTRRTGEAHWETLLRARAIETGCWVLAPAQGGRHEDGRSTWGRSTIVDPWGAVHAKIDGDEPGVLVSDINMSHVAQVRSRIPALQHDRAVAAP